MSYGYDSNNLTVKNQQNPSLPASELMKRSNKLLIQHWLFSIRPNRFNGIYWPGKSISRDERDASYYHLW